MQSYRILAAFPMSDTDALSMLGFARSPRSTAPTHAVHVIPSTATVRVRSNLEAAQDGA